MVDDDASCDADVHGVLGAKLRNLQTAVGGVDDFLMHALYLVAQDNSIAVRKALSFEPFYMKGGFRAALGLFHCITKYSNFLSSSTASSAVLK